MLLRLTGSLLLALSTTVWGQLGPQKTFFRVKEILIRGNKKVEQEAIREKIDARVGKNLTNYILQKDIKTLYEMNYFSEVVATEIRPGVLEFFVKERPVIGSVFFEGNDEIDDEDLNEKIKVKKYSILNINKVKNDAAELQKYYEEKGHYLATVDYEIRRTTGDSINLVFKIKEYDKVRVKKITFLGNRAFKDGQLKSLLETREDSLFSFMTNSGNFKEFSFQTDIERLKYFYKTKGYLQINVGRPLVTVSEDKKWLFITVKVNEGPQYKVNEIFYDGDIIFPMDKLEEKVSLEKGKLYSEDQLRKDIMGLTELYQDEGYAFVNVMRTLEVVPGKNRVNIQFLFEKGEIAYFGRITVKGNTKTRDKVVRRELKIFEGMKFSGTKLRESRESVNRLGFFEPKSVLFQTRPVKRGGKNVLDLEIHIKERNTGTISVGAGYSTAQKGFLQASISQNNFRGLGQSLTFMLSLAKNNKEYRLGLVEPYLFDTKWTAGGDIFNTKSERDSFRSEKKGFDLRIGHPIFENTRLFLVYKFVDTDVQREDPTLDLALENGISSSVETSVVHDKRNNRMEPSKGLYAGLSVEFAGVGGDQEWLRSEFDGRAFFTLVDDLVLRSRLVMGRLFQTTQRKIPRTQKFVLGGSRNLRGYGYEAVGPTKFANITRNGVTREQRFNLGGLFKVFSTLELEYPLVREAGLKWVTFFDIGNVYKDYIGKDGDFSMRADYGFGFRWFSPIGVLRFEFGYPLNPKKGDDGRQFFFDIGQIF